MKIYEPLQLEVICFEEDNIIVTSNPPASKKYMSFIIDDPDVGGKG